MKFSDVLDIRNGRNQRQVENANGKYPIYGSGGVMGRATDFICDAGTVVIGRKGSINNPFFVDEPFWNVDTAFGLVAHRDVLLPKYLFYFCVNFDFEQLNTTVTIPSLTKANLLQIEINVPDMDEQRYVVRVLDKICRLTDLQEQELHNLDQLVKSRFIELFGEPLSNQKGWQTMSIVEAAPIKSQRGDLADEVWLLNLDAVEAQTGTVLFKHRVQSGEINASTVYFTAESVLYSKLRPYLNKVVMPDENGVATSEMIPMYPLADRLNRAYLCYWLRSDAFVRHISEKVAGAKMPRVSMDYFRSLAIEMPPLELQEQFAAFVEQTDKSKYYSSLSFRYCQAAANTYRQEWMTCRTSDF